MTSGARRAIASVAVAATVASSLVGCSVAGSSSTDGSSGSGHPEQIQLALPGGQWRERGDEEFRSAMNAWSDQAMSPGSVSDRSYLVRNRDARAGVWTVTLGAPEVSDNGYFAVGVEVRNAGKGRRAPVPSAPAAILPGQDGVTWLAGHAAADRENVSAARAGDVLATVELGSCESAAVTDWVAFPEVSDSYYQQGGAIPNIHATFTPESGDPDEFLPADCPEDTFGAVWRSYLTGVMVAVAVAVWAWHLHQHRTAP